MMDFLLMGINGDCGFNAIISLLSLTRGKNHIQPKKNDTTCVDENF
jgi:hypothetical protein